MCEVRETAGDGRHGEGERFGDLSLYVLRYRRVGERERGKGLMHRDCILLKNKQNGMVEKVHLSENMI